MSFSFLVPAFQMFDVPFWSMAKMIEKFPCKPNALLNIGLGNNTIQNSVVVRGSTRVKMRSPFVWQRVNGLVKRCHLLPPHASHKGRAECA